MVFVQGEAGIGKTTLIRRFINDLDGFNILWASCDYSEVDYAFGVIGQLASATPRDIRSEIPLLAGEVPSDAAPFQVGVQMLDLLGRLQDDGPVAIVVDDAQWADEASAQTLGFVLRRLVADRVLTVLVSREGVVGGDQETWHRLTVGRAETVHIELRGLDRTETAELATSFGPLETGTIERLRNHTGGHPLYLRQLLTDISTSHPQGSPEDFPVPLSLAQAVQRHVAELDESSRRLLQAVAVLDARSPLAVVSEVAGISDAATALAPLVESGFVDWWPGEPSTPVAMHHQLQRQAVYESLEPIRRRQMHQAAVPLVNQYAAWAHRVAATDMSDPELATRLEDAANQAFADGMPEHAATWMLWAADLSDIRGEHERRLLAAAIILFQRVNVVRLTQLRSRVEACEPSSLRDAILGYICYTHGEISQTEQYLGEVIGTAANSGDPLPLAVAQKGLISLYTWMGRGKEAQVFLTMVPEFGTIDNSTWAWMQYAVFHTTMFAKGPHAARQVIDEADILAKLAVMDPHARTLLLLTRGTNYAFVGDLAASISDLTELLKLKGPQMATDGLILCSLSYAQYLRGDWDAAARNAEQAIGFATIMDIVWHYGPSHMVAAMIAAARGDWDSAEAQARLCRKYTRAGGKTQKVHEAMVNAAMAQAKGDYAEILTALRPLLEQPDNGWVSAYRNCWLPWYVEALIGSGALDQATTALEQLNTEAERTPSLGFISGWLSGWLAEANGDLTAARAHYAAAREQAQGPDTMMLYLARLEHAHGKALLASHRRKDGIETLRKAHNHYATLGARPFLERCDEDLKVAGLPTPNEAPEKLLNLTDREREVVPLLKRGLSNHEIAEELYVSVKTIESRLTSVYTKYGVSSRRELRALLIAT